MVGTSVRRRKNETFIMVVIMVKYAQHNERYFEVIKVNY